MNEEKFKNLSVRELLDILPATIEHKILEYSLEDGSWHKSEGNYRLSLEIQKYDPIDVFTKEHHDIWLASYTVYALDGGIEQRYPLPENKKAIECWDWHKGGFRDNNLHTVLIKLYKWLVSEGIL